jgi:hypothetical protein
MYRDVPEGIPFLFLHSKNNWPGGGMLIDSYDIKNKPYVIRETFPYSYEEFGTY